MAAMRQDTMDSVRGKVFEEDAQSRDDVRCAQGRLYRGDNAMITDVDRFWRTSATDRQWP